MDPIDNLARPNDAFETLRVLVEEGQGNPMYPTRAHARELCGSSQTALHLYTGPLEGFQYLIKQQRFEIDLSVKNARGTDVEDTQLSSRWVSSTTLGRFLMESSSQFTGERYPQRFGPQSCT
jgi:hypothetical protein